MSSCWLLCWFCHFCGYKLHRNLQRHAVNKMLSEIKSRGKEAINKALLQLDTGLVNPHVSCLSSCVATCSGFQRISRIWSQPGQPGMAECCGHVVARRPRPPSVSVVNLGRRSVTGVLILTHGALVRDPSGEGIHVNPVAKRSIAAS